MRAQLCLANKDDEIYTKTSVCPVKRHFEQIFSTTSKSDFNDFVVIFMKILIAFFTFTRQNC